MVQAVTGLHMPHLKIFDCHLMKQNGETRNECPTSHGPHQVKLMHSAPKATIKTSHSLNFWSLLQDTQHADGKNDKTPIVLTAVMEFYLSGGATGVLQFGQHAPMFYQSADRPSSKPLEQGRLPLVVFHSRAWHCSVEPDPDSFPYKVSFF